MPTFDDMQEQNTEIKFVHSIFLMLAIILSGCVTTNDFKVVDALQIGMSREEVKATIFSYGFQLEEVLSRPSLGWVGDDTFTNLPGRAKYAEERAGKNVKIAEYYPVGHGILGFGQLFVFYDNEEKVVEFYRRQIN